MQEAVRQEQILLDLGLRALVDGEVRHTRKSRWGDRARFPLSLLPLFHLLRERGQAIFRCRSRTRAAIKKIEKDLERLDGRSDT
jgi:hypothetical protein